MSAQCIKAIISGRVQGVFFRESTRKQAVQLGIRGHAINLSDGCVEVLACGTEDTINQLIQWLHQGPEYARVTDVKTHPIEIDIPSGFYTR
ncbi:MAG: acylphosphatase [Gammaproteobacteria bacterium]|nr:acylphosphatase [Gammaproteobacteria bacterium]